MLYSKLSTYLNRYRSITEAFPTLFKTTKTDKYRDIIINGTIKRTEAVENQLINEIINDSNVEIIGNESYRNINLNIDQLRDMLNDFIDYLALHNRPLSYLIEYYDIELIGSTYELVIELSEAGTREDYETISEMFQEFTQFENVN